MRHYLLGKHIHRVGNGQRIDGQVPYVTIHCGIVADHKGFVVVVHHQVVGVIQRPLGIFQVDGQLKAGLVMAGIAFIYGAVAVRITDIAVFVTVIIGIVQTTEQQVVLAFGQVVTE